MLTEEQLNEWRELCEKATKGPCVADYQPYGPCGAKVYSNEIRTSYGEDVTIAVRPRGTKATFARDMANGRLAAEAFTAMPRLLREVERLRKENERLKSRIKANINMLRHCNGEEL